MGDASIRRTRRDRERSIESKQKREGGGVALLLLWLLLLLLLLCQEGVIDSVNDGKRWRNRFG